MNRSRFLAFSLLALLSVAVLAVFVVPVGAADDASASVSTRQTAVFAGGCFWGVDAVFKHVKGVDRVVSGYAGGPASSAQYETVSTGTTGHAESVEVTYDPSQVSYNDLLKVFFYAAHDPTELNQQGPDEGTQYRSAIFYETEAQREVAEKSKAAAQGKFSQPIVTEIEKAGAFYPAERYHQDYYKLNKGRNPYCQIVIAPKLEKLGMDL